MRAFLPNLCTCCNLLCGGVATVCAFAGNFPLSLLWMVLGALCDFADGFVARGVRVASPIGKELDSLADEVSFGICPSAMLYVTLQGTTTSSVLPYAALLLAIFSALRLAKFNIDTRQSLSFRGLPTPANALLWSSLLTAYSSSLQRAPYAVPLLLVGVALTCFLLVCELPMFAMKFTSWRLHDGDNLLRYLFLVLAGGIIIAAIIVGNVVASLLYIMLAYILLSIGSACIKH